MPACRACSAPIRFAKHISTGKPHPVDEKPSQEGNLVLFHDAQGVLRVRHAKLPDDQLLTRYTSHFSTCPKAGQFRRGK